MGVASSAYAGQESRMCDFCGENGGKDTTWETQTYWEIIVR